MTDKNINDLKINAELRFISIKKTARRSDTILHQY